MAGYPGSGKSTLAQKIAEHWSGTTLSSDSVREQLFSTSRYDPQGDSVISQQRAQIYPALAELARKKLAEFPVVVIDATNVETSKRNVLVETFLASESPHSLAFVLVQTPHSVIAERMQAIQNQNTTTESFFEAWQRVYAIFLEKEQQGLLSWPAYPGIANYTEEEIYAILDN